MKKTITLRFPSSCKRCGQRMPAGTTAQWLGKGAGVQHMNDCKPAEKKEIQKPPRGTNEIERMTFDFHELRSAFIAWTREGWRSILSPVNEWEGDHLPRDTWAMEDWVGCSVAEMQEWLANGFHVPGLEGISSLVPTRPRRKLKYGEEGDELLIDLVHSGDDNPFVEWEKRPRNAGLSLEIHTVVNSHYPAETMTKYQTWIARALQTLDASGVDVEVNIIMRNDRLHAPFINEDGSAKMRETAIRVRKPGEAIDFASWSAMFSPGGYRQLGFTAWTLHADRNGAQVDKSLGHAVDYGAWDVVYDPERNVIVFGNSQRDYTFPEAEMTEKLQTVLNQLTGA